MTHGEIAAPSTVARRKGQQHVAQQQRQWHHDEHIMQRFTTAAKNSTHLPRIDLSLLRTKKATTYAVANIRYAALTATPTLVVQLSSGFSSFIR